MRIVVVGAGISGLVAAHALRSGADPASDVIVVEALSGIGGKLRVSDVGGLLIDEGAETFLARAPEGRELIQQVGLAGSLVYPATTSASLWARDEFRPMPSATLLGVPSSLRSLEGVLSRGEIARAALDQWLPGPRLDELDDIAVGEWVGRRLGRAVVDRVVDPLLGGVYAGRAAELSLRATMPMLKRDHRSALAAAAASVAAPPAVGSAPAPVFGTLAGGMGSLPAAALRASGAALISGRAVRRIERLAPLTPGTRPRWRVIHGPTTDEQPLDCDGVVIAVPAAAAARLLSDVVPAAAIELGAIEAASVAIITTVWRRDSAGSMPGSGYLVPATSIPRRIVKAVTFASVKWPHLDRGGLVAVRCSIGRHGDVAELQRDDSELVAAAVDELASYSGFQGVPVASRVSRWGGALPQYAVGHLNRVARIRTAIAGASGLAVCGATYDGVGVPACIRTGRQAAADVLTDLGLAPEPR